MSATTHIINWKANTVKQPLVVITDPESITTGDKIKISLYSASQYDLISPYRGLGSKTIAQSLPRQDEIIDLSGSSEISAKYPIKSVFNILAAIPIVDETSRAIVVEAGMPMLAFISVVNQQLKIADGVKLHGSIRLVYETFNAQVWTHNPFAKKCSAVLFAHNLTTLEYENVPLSISEKTATARDSIKIEWYPTEKFSYTPYAHFIVYPTGKNLSVKCDVGTANAVKVESREIEKEEISFSGLEANASYFINSLKSFTGYFFDAKGNEISPSFRVSDGILKSNAECWGKGYLKYFTSGTVYAYNAEVTTINLPGGGTHTDINVGTAFAFEKGKNGIAASYDIPLNTMEITSPVDFCKVYKEIVIDNFGSWEKPDGFSGDDNTQIQQYVVATGFIYSNEITDVAEYQSEILSVYKGQAFTGVKYKLESSIDTSASAYAQEAMETKQQELVVKYGIVT